MSLLNLQPTPLVFVNTTYPPKEIMRYASNANLNRLNLSRPNGRTNGRTGEVVDGI